MPCLPSWLWLSPDALSPTHVVNCHEPKILDKREVNNRLWFWQSYILCWQLWYYDEGVAKGRLISFLCILIFVEIPSSRVEKYECGNSRKHLVGAELQWQWCHELPTIVGMPTWVDQLPTNVRLKNFKFGILAMFCMSWSCMNLLWQ